MDSLIQQAASLLKLGQLIAFPTETVYGLGADATNDKAVAEIFAVKGRPQFNPLIIHVSSIEMAKEYVAWNDNADKLFNKFMPAPLTLVLPRLKNSKISLLASAGGDTIAIRIPNHKIALELINTCQLPIAAPSANRSGRISPTNAEAVYQELGDKIAMIINGGDCDIGIESTVIDLSSETPTLLRHGFITITELEDALETKILSNSNDVNIKSPGQLLSHYAPSLPVRINATKVNENEALLAFGSNILQNAKTTLNLSESGDLKEAAANLFKLMRELDNPSLYQAIAIMPIPQNDIGLAINDRLTRASYTN
jgi:L-threonylcarbamoyladenylate synthase